MILLVLGGTFYYLNIPKPVEPKEPQYYAWLIEMDDIQHIVISLPSENMSQSFIKISTDDFPWYFDDPQQSAIDRVRWGGGIPLLLSGPGVARYFSNAPQDKLAEYGLTKPQMVIDLILADNTTMNINIGDTTPDGTSHYVMVSNTTSVGLVDYSWFDVLKNLVIKPPYATTTPAK
jgi:hypothetical protein